MLFPAKTVTSRVSNRFSRSQQTPFRSRRRTLGNAVESVIELLESRQLLTATGIGVNFTGGGNNGSGAVTLAPTDTAGVFPVANYNNENGGTQTAVALTDSTGAATPVTLTYTSGGTWNSVGSAVTPPAGDGDQELNDGFVFGNSDVMLSGIPYANYDVYAYELNDGAGRVQVTTDVNTGTSVYGSSATPTDANHESGVSNNYQYIAATGSTSATANPNADFAVFSGGTPNFEFQTSVTGGNGYLNGFEIVDHTTTAPTLNAATAGKNAVALAWTYGSDAQSGNFTYTVYRSDPAHAAAAIATGVTAQSYTDTTAVNGTAYTYSIVANNAVGPSAHSNSLTATPGGPAPASVGVNFTGGGNGPAVDLAPTDSAGVFPIANYNNKDGGTQTGTPLNDSTGNPSPVSLTYTSPGTYNSRNIVPATPDQELNNGFIYGNSDVQLTGIPDANYDVYIYELNDAGGRIEQTTDVNTGVSVFGASASPTDASHESGVVNNYQYVAATGTTSATNTPNADFAVFSGSTSNFEFQTTAPGNGYLNGFEIVDHTNSAATLTAATPGNNAVALAWTYGNTQANGFTYTIYRSDPAHAAAAIATVSAQTYVDSTAVNGTTYTYYIVANNAIGPSANSNSLMVTPVFAPPPVPTGIAASRTNATTVAISFNSALGATSYDVQRGTALNANGTLGGTITDITPGGTTQTSVTDTSALPSGFYAVTATNATGTSAASIAVFVDNGDGWQASYYASDTANAVVYDGDQTASVALTQPDGTAIPTTITQPTNPTPANNAVLGFLRNENTPINDVNLNNTIAPPNAPSSFNTIENGNPGQDFAVRWVGYIEAPYTGYYTLNPNSDDGVAVTTFDTTHLTGGLPTPVTLPTDNIFVPRGAATDSDPVVDSTGAPVQWIAGQKYEVQMDYNNQGGGWQAVLSYSVSSSVANQAAGTYDLQSSKLVPISQVVAPVPTFQTVDAANPGGLAKDSTYYTVSALAGNTAAQLTFSSIGADSYNIYRSTSPTGPFTTPIANVPGTNGGPVIFTDTGLTNGTKYYYVITGVDNSGETPIASGLTTNVTPVAIAPAAPTNLTATRTGENTVALTWGPSVFATSYDVKRGTVLNADGTLGGTITDVTPGGTTSTSATDSNAFQRTTFYYQVTATNGGGTSTPSNTATVTAIFSLVANNAISVNFTGGGNGGAPAVSMLPTDKAGVVPEANYNNEAGGTQTAVALNDSTGAATAATLTYNGGGNYSTVGGTTFVPANGDQKLNDGFVYGTTTVEVDNIPYANYDVYVYELNDSGGRVETTVDNSTGQTFYGSSANPTDANHESGTPNTYLYTQSTDTTGTAPTAGGDYVLFANQNGGTFIFNDSAPGNGYLTGFEIVDHPTAAPTAAPVLSPATAGSGTVSLTYTSVPEASSYTVYRSDPGHPAPVIVATNIPTTTYTDNTVTNGVTYTYTVSGDNAIGAGPQSNAVMATPIAVTAPTLVGLPAINGDNPNGLFTAVGQPAPGTQRSMVEDVVYTFSSGVTIPNAAAAFTVVGTGPNAGTAPASLTATAVAGTGGTQWAVNLTGAPGTLGSIANGEYSITINPAGVFAAADGTTQLAAGRTDQFYRLYGDINGDEVVNGADSLQLKRALSTYNPAFDVNGDGFVNASDELQFKKDLKIAFFGDGFVPTI